MEKPESYFQCTARKRLWTFSPMCFAFLCCIPSRSISLDVDRFFVGTRRAVRTVIPMKSENVSGTRRSNGPIFDLGQHKLFSCFLFRSIAWEIIYGKD